MGAYISTQECRRMFDITVNCKSRLNSTNDMNFVGDYSHGEVPADPDVAGIGIIFMFVAVTSLALLVSIIDFIWRIIKFRRRSKHEPTDQEKIRKLNRSCGPFQLSRLVQTIILSCSDQQVFTGGAYALSLRYWKSCTVTAYHYNIIAKMLLLTCATHLLSVAVVRHYWRYALVAIVRVALTTAVFVVTGILLGNQNAAKEMPFPTSVPPLTVDQSSPIMMLALCFQDSKSPAVQTFLDSFKDKETAEQAFIYARPGNKIEGWNMYLFILFCYGLSLIALVGLGIFRSDKKKQLLKKALGPRGALLYGNRGGLRRKLSKLAFGVYLLACLVVSGVTIVMQTIQIYRMRTWVRHSGWLENEGGKSDEDSWSSFGQLVPMFLGLLTLFKILEEICIMCSSEHRQSLLNNLNDTGTGGPQGHRPPYQPVPTGPYAAPAVNNMLPHPSQGNRLRSSARPAVNHRDSAGSAVPLLGRPGNGANSPPYPANRHYSDGSLYSAYSAVNAGGSPGPHQGKRGSFPRRPVGRNFSPRP